MSRMLVENCTTKSEGENPIQQMNWWRQPMYRFRDDVLPPSGHRYDRKQRCFWLYATKKKKGNIQKARRKKANATGNRRKRGNAKNELFEGRKTTTTRRKNKKNMIIEKFHSFWRQRTILWEIIAHPTAPPSAKRKTKTCTATSAGPIITPAYPSKPWHFWERQRKRKKTKKRVKKKRKSSAQRPHPACIQHAFLGWASVIRSIYCFAHP